MGLRCSFPSRESTLGLRQAGGIITLGIPSRDAARRTFGGSASISRRSSFRLVGFIARSGKRKDRLSHQGLARFQSSKNPSKSASSTT